MLRTELLWLRWEGPFLSLEIFGEKEPFLFLKIFGKKGPFLVPRKKWKKDHLWCLFEKILSSRYIGRFPHSLIFTNDFNNSTTSGSQVKFAAKNRLSDWWWGFFLGKIFGPYKEITNMANRVSFYLVNESRPTLNSDCDLPCDQLSDTEPKRLFRCKVLEQMVMLDF